MEVDPGDLTLDAGVVTMKGAPERSISLGEVVKANRSLSGETTVSAEASWDSPTELPDPDTRYGKVTAASSFVCVVAVAAVDTETEVLIQEAVGRLVRNRTTLIIAHRLSTVRHADALVVLDKGRVAEMGNHSQLLARGGLYSRMIEAQNPAAVR